MTSASDKAEKMLVKGGRMYGLIVMLLSVAIASLVAYSLDSERKNYTDYVARKKEEQKLACKDPKTKRQLNDCRRSEPMSKVEIAMYELIAGIWAVGSVLGIYLVWTSDTVAAFFGISGLFDFI